MSSTPNDSPAGTTGPYTGTPPVTCEALPAIPGYEMLGRLGQGGMGVVYQARQVRVNRLVAVKMLRAGDRARPQEHFRFRLETEAVGRLQHPNIVQIFEVGEVDGCPFAVLEFVEGGSLAQRLAGGPLRPAEAAALVETLARAIQVAHDHGIIHRDLKPGNVLLAGAAADLVPKVADFGLAKQLDTDSGQTSTGVIVGTPAYMAPEQAAGHAALVGAATDIYALGVVLYECLTGRRPFEADSVMKVLKKVSEEEPLPPRKIAPGLPRDLEVVCLKCLRKEPVQRYQSARALADDLHHYRQGEPIQARPVGRMGRAWAWSRRRPALAASYLLAALALLLGAGAVGAVWLWRDAEAARRLAEGAQERAEQARAGETAAKEALDQVLYLERVELAHREWLASNVSRTLQLLDECPEARRGWEWHYVRRLPEPMLDFARPLPDGTQTASDWVALSPDGRHVVAGSRINGLRIWDGETGRELAVLEGSGLPRNPQGGHGTASAQPVRAQFTHDGLRVIGGSPACAVGEWDAVTGKLLRRRGRLPFRPGCLAAHPDDRHVATGAFGSGAPTANVAILDLDNSEPARMLAGHRAPVSAVAYSPDGSRLASGAQDGEVILWNVADGKAVLKLPRLTDRIVGVALAPDSKRVAAVAVDGSLAVWQAADGKELLMVNTSGVGAKAVTFVGNERVAAGMVNGEVSIWEVAARRKAFSLRGHRGPSPQVNSVAATTDGRRLVSTGGDGKIKVWDATTGPEYRAVRLWDHHVATLGMHPGADLVVALGVDGSAELWYPTGPRRLWKRQISPAILLAAAISRDGRRLAFGDADKVVRVCDAQGNELHALAGHAEPIYSLCFSPDGRYLASGAGKFGVSGEAKVWDLTAPGTGATLTGVRRTILALSFSPDGRRATGVDDSGGIVVWDVSTAGEVWHRDGIAETQGRAAYRPDGGLLAMGSSAGRVELLNPDNGDLVRVLTDRGSSVESVAFTPDGLRLATGGAQVTLWDIGTGQPALTLPGSAAGLTFTPDGQRLIGCEHVGILRTWDATPLPADAAR
jgi:WD40 repeat protein